MDTDEAQRLLKHGNPDTPRSGCAKTCVQAKRGGARAGAAVHTPGGGGAAMGSPGNCAAAAAKASEASAVGSPAAGLCNRHQGHCMPMLEMGEPLEADEEPSAPTGSAWIQNMPLTLHT